MKGVLYYVNVCMTITRVIHGNLCICNIHIWINMKIQALSLGSKCSYTLSHLPDPGNLFQIQKEVVEAHDKPCTVQSLLGLTVAFYSIEI